MDDEREYGETLVTWKTHAYPHYTRGPLWYAAAGVLGVVLIALAVWTYNFSFAALLVMFAIVVFLQATRPPLVLDVHLTNMGVLFGTRFIPYKDLKDFWIIYDPPIRTLYVDLKRALFPRIQICLEEENPVEVRETLKQFLHEDTSHDHEPALDIFSRMLKM